MTGWPRLPLPERMSPEQAAIHDSSVARFGGPYGPRLPLVLAPGLHAPWAEMSERLAAGALPGRLRELAILVTARFWGADFIWYAHEDPALAAGLPPRTLDLIRAGKPVEGTAAERAVAEVVTELLERHRVGDRTHARAAELIGTGCLVELTVLVGHYSGVAFLLAVHAAPLPGDAGRPLSAPTEEERP
ncbi:carboxymuconolactone decarboxylase family protein [Actinomadura graeca]|uniref:Carboxymuconolactone decarboxylase family protein n=1 Tax=Actinomadura graeca TaxID=2750812 RepID=A0ABX8QRW7_9ACTN|nr:carboxymuconolactone decarboxylase family protein [Actinomadura graeca]QXJ21146.1 carboxymuconolactone decarboxylase family protein [Actinomadura graeca]